MDKTLKIMIVEDNPHARCALKALISQQAGIDVTAEASNGQEAIRNIQGQVPDIVLMDMRMPVMDGLEATKIIKKTWPQIKIVILTMYPDCRSDVLVAGADGFLVKGCFVEEITSTIRSLNETTSKQADTKNDNVPPGKTSSLGEDHRSFLPSLQMPPKSPPHLA